MLFYVPSNIDICFISEVGLFAQVTHLMVGSSSGCKSIKCKKLAAAIKSKWREQRAFLMFIADTWNAVMWKR